MFVFVALVYVFFPSFVSPRICDVITAFTIPAKLFQSVFLTFISFRQSETPPPKVFVSPYVTPLPPMTTTVWIVVVPRFGVRFHAQTLQKR